MNNLKLITASISIIVLIIISMIIIQLLLKKFKNKTDEDGELKNSFLVFFSGLFLAGAIVIKNAIAIIIEIIDILIKIHPQNLFFEELKSISLVIGVSFIWYLVWFYIMKFIFKIIYTNTNDELAMEKNSYGYFLAKGIIFVSLIFCVSSILEIILRTFLPVIEIPFYR